MFLPQSVYYTMISWSMPAYCATGINFDKMPVRGHYTISMCIQLSYSSSFLGHTPWYNALRLAKSQCHGHWAWFPACILCLQLVNQSARKQVHLQRFQPLVDPVEHCWTQFQSDQSFTWLGTRHRLWCSTHLQGAGVWGEYSLPSTIAMALWPGCQLWGDCSP